MSDNPAVALLVRCLHVVAQRGSERDARCPGHDDHRASLTFGPGAHGGAVLHCHAGCSPETVLEAVGLSFRDISPDPHIVAIYDYRDEGGTLLWRTERWQPKTFRQRGLPAPGGRVLYHSEWLPNARAEGRTVYLVEGEKDADTLAKTGEVGLCCVNGAGAWLAHYAEQLSGLDVVVIADADEPGKAHARQVAKSLDGVAASVALTLPSYGKDVSDQLEAGYDLSTLIPLSIEPELGIHRLDHIREREVSWLWPGYVPAGKLTLIDGDPGDGKSVLTCDLAARFSAGTKLPDGKRVATPTNVVMISAEDDPEDTIAGRLRVAGANGQRVWLLTEGILSDAPFSFARDLAALESFVTTNHVGLVTIDPLMSFLPENVDAYRDAEVRRVLMPVTRMAARTQCAIVVVRHLTKARGRAITAGGGSMGFIGAARAAFLVGTHPEDDKKRVLAPIKMNIGPLPDPLGYQIVSSRLGDRWAPPMVRWDSEPLKLTAQEVLGGGDDEEREARIEARSWLQNYLRAHPNGMTWVEIHRAGKREGHTEITLRRVRRSVAYMQTNPLGTDGTIRPGTFWFTTTTNGDNGASGRHLELIRQAEPEKSAAGPPDLLERSSNGQPEPTCEICGQPPAQWFPGEQTHRCLQHRPLTLDEFTDGDD